MERLLVICSLEDFEREHVRPANGRVLVVGSHVYATRVDRRTKFVYAVGVDMIDGEGVDYVCNLEEEAPEHLGPFGHIDCISVLEHSARPWLLAQNLEKLMGPKTTICISVPFVWRIHGYPNDYWRFTTEAIRRLFPKVEWKQLIYVPSRKGKVEAQRIDDKLYFRRTEVVGFGVKK